jgi:hypothetical protein
METAETTVEFTDQAGAVSMSPASSGSAIFGDSLAVLNGLLAPIPEDRKRRLRAFARECIRNSGGDPDATPNAANEPRSEAE